MMVLNRNGIGKTNVSKREENKRLLEKFTLEQLHSLCKFYKREIQELDYRDIVVLGETNPEIIKIRFASYIVNLFNQEEIKDFARKHQIKID